MHRRLARLERVIAAVVTSGDAGNVATTRTWILAAVGALLIVSAGAGSLLLRHQSNVRPTDSSPFPVGQVFTTQQWAQVKTSLVARGFDGAAARVVSGLRLQRKSEPFALVRATSPSRGVCFLPVRGLQPGAATCSSDEQLPTPLLVFSARDRWGNRIATAVVGVARHAITSVSIIDPRGIPAGVALIPAAGGLWSFAGGFGNTTKLVIQARVASARVVAQTTLR
jgi:hypothetical protein